MWVRMQFRKYLLKAIHCAVRLCTLVFLLSPSADASDNSWPFEYNWPHSIAQSQRHGHFAFIPQVSPTEFVWEGRQYRVDETWVETYNGGDMKRLFVKIKPSGKAPVSARQNHRDRPLMIMQRANASSEIDARRGIDWYQGIGSVIQTIVLKNSDMPELQLAIGSSRWEKVSGRSIRNMTDQVLTIQLAPQNRI
jgi:hypothetical protein